MARAVGLLYPIKCRNEISCEKINNVQSVELVSHGTAGENVLNALD